MHAERFPLTYAENVPYNSDMNALSSLFALSDAYAKATDLAEGTISDRVLKGGNRLRDLRAGTADIGVRRLASAINWFSDNWPEGASWPADVPRPAKTREAA